MFSVTLFTMHFRLLYIQVWKLLTTFWKKKQPYSRIRVLPAISSHKIHHHYSMTLHVQSTFLFPEFSSCLIQCLKLNIYWRKGQRNQWEGIMISFKLVKIDHEVSHFGKYHEIHKKLKILVWILVLQLTSASWSKYTWDHATFVCPVCSFW